MRAALALAIVVGAAGAARADDAQLDGLVQDADTFEPIAGATVTVDATGATAITGDAGELALTVPAGALELVIAAPGRPVGRVRLAVPAGATTAVFLIDPGGHVEAGEAIVIAEEFHEPPPPPPPAAVRTTVDAAEAAHVAGAAGDPGKVVTNLAGVARPAAGSAALVVWGAAPEDTAILVDGVPLPALYHLGGVRSVLAGDLIGTLQLEPGAFGADVGRVLGGAVRITTSPIADHPTARIAVDALDASAAASAPVSRRVRAAGALRWSWIDRLVGGALDDRAAELFSLPRYRDGHVRVRTVLGKDEHVDDVALAGDDHLAQTIGADEPATARTRDVADGFARLWVRWQRAAGDVEEAVTPWLGVDDHRARQAAGGASAEERARTWRVGLRAEYRARAGARARLALGADVSLAESALARRGTLTVPAREGDPAVFGRPPGVDVAADDWAVVETELAPYATVELALGPVTLAPGLRLGALAIDTSRLLPRVGTTPAIGGSTFAWLVEPRVAATWRATARVRVSGAVGRYHRAPDPEDLSAVFGDPTLGPETATCATVAAAVDLGVGEVEVAAFRRDLSHLVTRSAAPSPSVAQVLVQDGAGAAEGIQVTARRVARRGLSGWLAYTYARSVRRDHPGAPARRFDYDQPHVLTAAASYARGRWLASARLRVASGMPRTPVLGAYYEARLDRWEPVFGATDASRLPTFVELDLRGERAFAVGGATVTAYLEVENATAHANVEDWVYAYDYGSREALRGLPILAIAGLEGRL